MKHPNYTINIKPRVTMNIVDINGGAIAVLGAQGAVEWKWGDAHQIRRCVPSVIHAEHMS